MSQLPTCARGPRWQGVGELTSKLPKSRSDHVAASVDHTFIGHGVHRVLVSVA